jgi:hypothetical protein
MIVVADVALLQSMLLAKLSCSRTQDAQGQENQRVQAAPSAGIGRARDRR